MKPARKQGSSAKISCCLIQPKHFFKKAVGSRGNKRKGTKNPTLKFLLPEQKHIFLNNVQDKWKVKEMLLLK